MEAARQKRVLVLNAGYEPLAAISWQKAMCLLFRDKVEVVETYTDFQVRSATTAFDVPAVIRLEDYARPAPMHTKFCRENVYLRDRYTCQYCGRKRQHRDLTFDHVQPRSRGGDTTWRNIVTACSTCNRRKGDRTPAEARMNLLSEPRVPSMSATRRYVFTQGREMPEQWETWLPE